MGHHFCFGPALFLELLLRFCPVALLDAFRPRGFIFQYHIFLFFHTVHGVLEARILKWFAIPFLPIHVGWPCIARLIGSLSYTSPFTTTRLWSMWSFWLAFYYCGFCSGGCGTVVLTLSICPQMFEDKRLVQASWWEGLNGGNIGSYSRWQSHTQ